MSQPSLTVIAGPNGSGKSSLVAELRRGGVDFGYHINADDIFRELGFKGDEGSRAAQQIADERREDCFERGIDFSFETVMSHPSKVDFMRRAAGRGFDVVLYFVATADPQLNVRRVQDRVALGGHDVPEERIVARYHRSLALLPSAILAARRSVVFDNSAPGDESWVGAGPLRPVLEVDRSEQRLVVNFVKPVPFWARAAASHLAPE